MVRRIVPVAVLSGGLLLAAAPAHAHCPLCTAGAALASGLAALAGVKFGAVGVFLGAFATALGVWAVRLVPRRFPGQGILLFLAVYLSTLLPLLPFTRDYSSWYIFWGGDYGSIFNRTYLINWFIVGAVLGSLILALSRPASAFLTKLRGGSSFRFQGILLTFLLLSATASLMQVVR